MYKSKEERLVYKSDGSGAIHAEGTIPATRFDLDRWMKTMPQPWTAAMEATVLTGWT
jgi:transposase